jgi:signal transduction histidine kinase
MKSPTVAVCSSERPVALPPPSHRKRTDSAAVEDRGATWLGLGIGEIDRTVGGLIRQGRPLQVILTALCQLFDASAEGFSSSVLILDRTGTRVRGTAGSSVPASYLKQLEGGRVNWTATPSGATINAKRPIIILDPLSDPIREGPGATRAAVHGPKLHEVSAILSLTGELLGLFAVYRRGSNADVIHCPSALLPKFTQLASAVIQRMRSDEALKRSAALLERTQQISSTCCFSWRVKTDEISWSKELCQIFELGPADSPVTLELIRSRIDSEDLPSFQEMIERARAGVSDFEFEPRLRLPDHSVKYLRVVAHRTRDPKGPLEYIGVVQDVTHRRQTEAALAKLRTELTHAARVTSLGVLTAAIAHEVSQPLAGIVTNASTCRRMLAAAPPDVDGARETARRTIRDAQRASEVIKRLRALFCKKGTSSESLDLNEVTREVLALSLSELERNKVSVRTELASELPRVQADRIQLQQVILNLFLNASDAMSGVDDRPRQLVIKTEQDEHHRVRLSVRDTGVGFEPQGIDRLFDAFYTTKSTGMGIGLSVSRSIIESHKGRLWATPNDGPGVTLSFSIPCRSQEITASVTDRRPPDAFWTSAATTNGGEPHVRSL